MRVMYELVHLKGMNPSGYLVKPRTRITFGGYRDERKRLLSGLWVVWMTSELSLLFDPGKKMKR